MKARRLAETLPSGYKPFTTFFTDLDIANQFGASEVMATYNRICKEWLNDYKYFTEFVLCLNLHCWDRYNQHGASDKIGKLYHDLFFEAKEKLWNTHGDDDEKARYIFDTLEM